MFCAMYRLNRLPLSKTPHALDVGPMLVFLNTLFKSGANAVGKPGAGECGS